MNTVTVTGIVATAPNSNGRRFVAATRFDIAVPSDDNRPFARRQHTLHVRADNDLATTARQLNIGDHITVTGHLDSEAFDMPDRTVWHRVEIIADAIAYEPVAQTNRIHTP